MSFQTGFAFSDHFLQVVNTLSDGSRVFGIGEQEHPTMFHDFNHRVWPLFARDQPPGWSEYVNLYGVHPFYMVLEPADETCHGVFFLNSNAQEFYLAPVPSITWRSIGGVMDIHIFAGPTCEAVIRQYTKFIGPTFMPPIWGLGYQLSRYGFENTSVMRDTYERNQVVNKIPIDLLYADIDHMQDRLDFTIDPNNFAELPVLFDTIFEEHGTRNIIILDPGLIADYHEDYWPIDMAKKDDILIKWPANEIPPDDFAVTNSNAMLGAVWPPGKVAFPDFMLPQTTKTWSEMVKRYYKEESMHFHGLWVDMNEIANFDTNKEKPWNWPDDKEPWSLKCKLTDPIETPPYPSWGVLVWKNYYSDSAAVLSDKTLCMSALLANGKYKNYDVHNLYGLFETEASLQDARGTDLISHQDFFTIRAMESVKPGKRTIIVSRSTFPSSGKFGGHWLGDNNSKYKDMRHSIIGMLEFNAFGVPYVGADVCGFNQDATAELCAKWHWLGAFYPYFRNHNSIDSKQQDPAFLGPLVVNNTKAAIQMRYSMLPYMYTLFHEAHTMGGTVLRPIFFEFPSFDALINAHDTIFMLGSSFLVAPHVEDKTMTKSILLPRGVWFYNPTHNKIYKPTVIRTCEEKESFKQYDFDTSYLEEHQQSEGELHIFTTVVQEVYRDDGLSKEPNNQSSMKLRGKLTHDAKLSYSKDWQKLTMELSANSTSTVPFERITQVRFVSDLFESLDQVTATKYTLPEGVSIRAPRIEGDMWSVDVQTKYKTNPIVAENNQRLVIEFHRTTTSNAPEQCRAQFYIQPLIMIIYASVNL